jgi:membrane protease YdiL (CAAX protease family)
VDPSNASGERRTDGEPAATGPGSAPAGASGSPEAPSTASPASASRAGDPVTEVLVAWAVACAVVAGIGALGERLHSAQAESAARIASTLVWIAVPVAIGLARRRSLEADGLAWRSPRRSLGLVALYGAVFLPLYTLVFFTVHGRGGWTFPSLSVPIVGLPANLIYAGLPEEIFFRGYAQPRLAGLWPGERPRRVLGIPLTRAIVAAAALFALTHAAFLPSSAWRTLAPLERLTTFLPGLLFGALREETGDVVAPALFHALCNAWLATLQHGYAT